MLTCRESVSSRHHCSQLAWYEAGSPSETPSRVTLSVRPRVRGRLVIIGALEVKLPNLVPSSYLIRKFDGVYLSLFASYLAIRSFHASK